MGTGVAFVLKSIGGSCFPQGSPPGDRPQEGRALGLLRSGDWVRGGPDPVAAVSLCRGLCWGDRKTRVYGEGGGAQRGGNAVSDTPSWGSHTAQGFRPECA